MTRAAASVPSARLTESDCASGFPDDFLPSVFPFAIPLHQATPATPPPPSHLPLAHTNTIDNVSRRRHHPLRDRFRSGHTRARPGLRIRTVRHHLVAQDWRHRYPPIYHPHVVCMLEGTFSPSASCFSAPKRSSRFLPIPSDPVSTNAMRPLYETRRVLTIL
jgi:hypothetical protein